MIDKTRIHRCLTDNKRYSAFYEQFLQPGDVIRDGVNLVELAKTYEGSLVRATQTREDDDVRNHLYVPRAFRDTDVVSVNGTTVNVRQAYDLQNILRYPWERYQHVICDDPQSFVFPSYLYRELPV